MNTEQLSMLEVAVELMSQKKTPQPIISLINEVLEIKGLDDPNGDYATQLYIDITTSSNFVFCGEGKWDLKNRQSLDLFDKDGSFFNTGEEYEEEEDTVDLSDYTIEEEETEYEDDEYDDEDDEYEEYDDDLLDDIDPTEDDEEDNFLDEQEYNDIMDDYEDMYEH